MRKREKEEKGVQRLVRSSFLKGEKNRVARDVN